MKEANGRNTIQRNVVYQAVQSMAHPTAENVYESVVAEYPNISRGTVYRNLTVLSEIGSIRHIPNPYGADHYDFRTSNHYHIICKRCGKISDVEMDYLPQIADRIHNRKGYRIESHEITFTGVCPGCQTKETTGSLDPEKMEEKNGKY